MPSLYQITRETLSWEEPDVDDIEFGNKSHGNVTSNPVAVCTSDNGPKVKDNRKKGRTLLEYFILCCDEKIKNLWWDFVIDRWYLCIIANPQHFIDVLLKLKTERNGERKRKRIEKKSFA